MKNYQSCEKTMIGNLKFMSYAKMSVQKINATECVKNL